MFVVGSRISIRHDGPSYNRNLVWNNHISLSRGHSQHETTLSITSDGTTNLAVLLLYSRRGLPMILSIIFHGVDIVCQNISEFDIQRRCKDHDRYSGYGL